MDFKTRAIPTKERPVAALSILSDPKQERERERERKIIRREDRKCQDLHLELQPFRAREVKFSIHSQDTGAVTNSNLSVAFSVVLHQTSLLPLL